MIGIFELIASFMLLALLISMLLHKLGTISSVSPFLTKLHTLGALLALGIMTGAIYFHLFTPLGIVMPHFNPTTGEEIGNDSGILFMMACGTWVCALILILLDMKKPEGLLNSRS